MRIGSPMASVFDEGKLPFKFITEETPFSSCFDSSAPPKPLLIATPTVNGTYPVLLLLHGFYLRNYFYKGILQHIASHGFIAVGPQVWTMETVTHNIAYISVSTILFVSLFYSRQLFYYLHSRVVVLHSIINLIYKTFVWNERRMTK